MYSNPPNYFWDEDAKKARYEEISKSLVKQFNELTKGRKPTNDENRMLFEASQRAYDTVYSPTQEQRWYEYVANATKIQDDFIKSWKGKKPTGKMFDDFNAELTAAYMGAMMDMPRLPPGEAPQLPPPPADLVDSRVPLPPPLEKHPEYGLHPPSEIHPDDIPPPPPLEKHPEYGLHLPSEPYPYDKGSLNRGKLYNPKIGLPSRNEENPIILAPSGAQMAVMSRPSPEDLNSAFQGVTNVFNAVYQTGVALSDEQISSAVGECFGLWSKHRITPPVPMLALINIFRTINFVSSNLNKFGNAVPIIKQHLDSASNAIISGEKDTLINVYTSLGAYATSYISNTQIVVNNMGQYIVEGTNFVNAAVANVNEKIAKDALALKSLQQERDDALEGKRRLSYELEQHKSEKKQLIQKFNQEMENANRALSEKDQILSSAQHEAYEKAQKTLRDEYSLKYKVIEEELSKKTQALANANEQVAELETQIQAIAANVEGYENFNGNLAKAVRNVVERANKAEQENKNEKALVEHLQNQIVAQNEETKNQIANYEETLERMKASQAEEIGKYKEILDEWEQYFDENENYRSLYERSINEQNQKLSDNLTTIGKLRYELTHGQTKSDEEKKALNDEILRLRNENSAISGGVRELEKELKGVKSQLENARTKIDSYKNEMKSKQTAQDIMEEKYKKALNQIETQNTTIQNLKNANTAKDQALVELDRQNSTMSSQLADYNEIMRQKAIAEAQAKSDHALVEELKKELDESKKLKSAYVPPSALDDVVVDPDLDAAAGLLEQAGAEIPPIPFNDQISILTESIQLSNIKRFEEDTSNKRKRGPPPPSTQISTSISKRPRVGRPSKRTSSSRERNTTRGGYVVGGRPDPLISPYGKAFWQKMYLSNYHLF